MSSNFLTQAQTKHLTIKEQVGLAPYTTIKIGGPARYFLAAASVEELVTAATLARACDIPLRVIGKGANILISDKGFSGLAIVNTSKNMEMNGTTVTADSGLSLGVLVAKTAAAALSGLETLAGVPATVGGAVHHNAGTRQGEIRSTVARVFILDQKNGQTRWLTAPQCDFQYRKSMFGDHPEFIILRVEFHLTTADKKTVQKKMTENLTYKHKSQNYDQPTSACTFKNYIFKNEADRTKAEKMGLEAGLGQDRLHSGWLIDQMGFKGRAIGRAQVSTTHANFILNLGGATAEDVIMLIGLIKQKARIAYGIQLQEEIEYVGF